MAAKPLKKSRFENGRLRSKLFIKFIMYAIVEIAGQQFKVEAGKQKTMK